MERIVKVKIGCGSTMNRAHTLLTGLFLGMLTPGVAIGQPVPPAAPAPADAAPATPAEKSAEEKPADDKRKPADKKDEAPKRPVSRRDHILRPGAPREALPSFRDPNPLEFKQPSDATMAKFGDYQSARAQPAANDPVIDEVAKFYVYRLTDANPRFEPAKGVDEAVRALPQEASKRAKATEFINQYVRALSKYARDVLDNSMLVRVNALVMLNRLNEGSANRFVEPVDVYIAAMEMPEQEDAVFFVALRGMDLAKANGTLGVRQERQAVELILNHAESKDVQPVLLDQMIDTLGRLERAFKGDRPDRAEVGTFLAGVIADPERELGTRLRAAMALGNLKTSEVPSWNHELQGLLLARSLAELITAADRGEINRTSTTYQWLVFRLGAGITKVYSFAQSDPDIADLMRIADPILKQAVSKNGQVNLEPLEAWIEKHSTPKSLKLAPGAAEVKL
jgi:hypothetical protein